MKNIIYIWFELFPFLKAFIPFIAAGYAWERVKVTQLPLWFAIAMALNAGITVSFLMSVAEVTVTKWIS